LTLSPDENTAKRGGVHIVSTREGRDNALREIPRVKNQDVWWRVRDSNPRPPRCERGALPAELTPQSGCSAWAMPPRPPLDPFLPPMLPERTLIIRESKLACSRNASEKYGYMTIDNAPCPVQGFLGPNFAGWLVVRPADSVVSVYKKRYFHYLRQLAFAFLLAGQCVTSGVTCGGREEGKSSACLGISLHPLPPRRSSLPQSLWGRPAGTWDNPPGRMLGRHASRP
jgi:hypothetical protein